MPIHRFFPFLAVTGVIAGALSSCQSTLPKSVRPEPLRAMDRRVKLERFMGDWYVIAHIPTFIEKDAFNAVERYEISDDGNIATTFFFNRGDFDGPLKTYHPRGFVHNRATNAEWRMQFVWPFKAAYLITYLDEDYETTIIGVPNRNYAWIMARTKTLPDAQFAKLGKILADTGHDITKLRRVPQR
ncbi:MAG: lipocalin family protein [Akkermansiaceae bacterium]